jgi:hypothetical protein
VSDTVEVEVSAVTGTAKDDGSGSLYFKGNYFTDSEAAAWLKTSTTIPKAVFVLHNLTDAFVSDMQETMVPVTGYYGRRALVIAVSRDQKLFKKIKRTEDGTYPQLWVLKPPQDGRGKVETVRYTDDVWDEEGVVSFLEDYALPVAFTYEDDSFAVLANPVYESFGPGATQLCTKKPGCVMFFLDGEDRDPKRFPDPKLNATHLQVVEEALDTYKVRDSGHSLYNARTSRIRAGRQARPRPLAPTEH